MRVEQLLLQDFRGFSRLNLDFHDTQVIVFVGVNGSGKSSVLDALAIVLSRFFARAISSRGLGRTFTDRDIRNQAISAYCSAQFRFPNADRSGALVGRMRRPTQKQPDMFGPEVGFHAQADSIRHGIESDTIYNAPLAVYYPANRVITDVQLKLKLRQDYPQTEAFRQALTGARVDYGAFFQWFRAREDLENEPANRQAGGGIRQDRQLEAVRRAVSELLPGFSNLHVRRAPLRMLITKDDGELDIRQLSDGEKCTLALVGDLARRLAIANPSRENPLDGEAIVLIDEIELHLHPGWQRMVVRQLPIVFPNCQFFLSTQSPTVISEISDGGLIILDRATAHRAGSYGHDVNSILEDIMGTEIRPQEVNDSLKRLSDIIGSGDLRAARELLDELREDIGDDDPEILRSSMIIRRMEAREVAPHR